MGREAETPEPVADSAPQLETEFAAVETRGPGYGGGTAVHHRGPVALPGQPPDASSYFAVLARRPVEQRAAELEALSATAGNAVVARSILGSAWSRVREFDLEISIHLPDASDAEKYAEIKRKMGYNEAVEYLWESFGDPAAAARANPGLFMESVKHDKSLVDMDAFDPVREEFKAAVEARVISNLNSNRNYVAEQMTKLGVGPGQQGKEKTADQDAALRNTQLLAEKVSVWQAGMARARKIKVGTRSVMKSGGSRSDMAHEVDKPVTFDPESPPERAGPPQGESSAGYRNWEHVKKDYDTLENGIKRVFAESPAVFATVQQKTGWFDDAGAAAGKLAGASPEEARAQLSEVLLALIAKIEAAKDLVGGDLDYRDFIPIHAQLMKSAPWSGDIEKAVIAEEVSDHEFNKVLISLGLSAIGAAAFIVAEFATAGMATFIAAGVGIGAGVAQAGMSLEDYLDKAAAYDAGTGDPSKDLVSSEQVDSALFQAILDGALAAIDAAAGIYSALSKLRGPAAMLAKAGEAGAERAAAATLKEALHSGEAAAKGAAIERSLVEAGVQKTLAASGKSAEELAEIVGKESETGKRLLAAAGVAKDAKGIEALSGNLAKFATLARAEQEATLRAAIDQWGYAGALKKVPGGWKGVTKTLGEGNALSKELDAWRSQLVEEMKQWLETASRGESKAVQTGTAGATSDVDISTVGADAAQNVTLGKEFIAKRAGVSMGELEAVLDLDAAVNPARMHLQDVVKGLSGDARAAIEREAAKVEEGLTYSRRYYKASKTGDAGLMAKIEEEAGGALNKSWVPLDPGQKAALEKQMDAWSKRLAKLEADGGSAAEKAELIRNIGNSQAQVLASSDTMYGTGGSIRKWVTERPPGAPGAKSDMEKLAEAGVKIDPSARAIWPGQRYTAILGEGHFLDHAFSGIRVGEGTELVGAIKDFGKHGGRVVEILGRDVAVTGMEKAVMDQLAADLAAWVKAAKGGLADEVKDVAKLAEIQRRLAEQTAKLNSAMSTGIDALRAQAKLGEALTADQLKGIDAWVRAQAAAQQRAQFMLDNLLKMELAAKAGVKAGAGAFGPDGEAATSSESSSPPPSNDEADAASSRL
jgi:hypothetical protein